MDDYGLQFLLAFDGRIHLLEKGYWLKFEIKQVEADSARPHGLRYSFTLHAPGGKRLLGFDNAHASRELGSRFKAQPKEHDHWHRPENDSGRPYRFVDAETLLDDFFKEVGRILERHRTSSKVVGENER